MSVQLTINSNIAALQTQRRLDSSTSALRRSFERLSSGSRITRASDDAAGLAISESLQTDRRVYTQGVRNLNDGVSLLSIAEGSLNELSNIVVRINELAEQAANGTLGLNQRAALDKEAQQLSAEYSRVANSTEFNGVKLFTGSVNDIRLQGGYGNSGAVISSIGGAKGNGTLAAPVSYTAESKTTYYTKLDDLNGDGLVDLLSSGQSDANTGIVTVRMGTGDGTFGAAISYSSHPSVSSMIETADINRDGIKDLTTAGYQTGGGFPGTISIRLGNGDGTFKTAVSYSTESVSTAVVIEDINNDGIGDLISAGQDGSDNGFASIRFGNADGTFSARISYSTESRQSISVKIVDINGDSRFDMVTAGFTDALSGAMTVRLGQAGGTFGAAVSYAMDSGLTNGFEIGDLNGDGKIDAVTAGQTSGSAGVVTVRFGNGNGTFGAANSFLMDTTYAYDVKLADLDGSGSMDIVTAGLGGGTGSTTIRLNNGDGTFGTAVSYSFHGVASYDVFSGDVDGDGAIDILIGGQTGTDGFATILRGNTTAGVGSLLPINLTTQRNAIDSLPEIRRAITRLAFHRGQIGAFQSRISSAISVSNTTIESYAAAASQIRDTDVSAEAAQLAKNNILKDASAAILAQANREPEIALKLLSSMG